jgi:peptidoglycan/LPS O-acetylase OafA/YrhL
LSSFGDSVPSADDLGDLPRMLGGYGVFDGAEAGCENGIEPAMVASDRDRIPSLDGVRAVAIGLVIISHIVLTHGEFHGDFRFDQYLVLGELGVRIFFVLSGFLITSLLIRELDATGSVNLKRFYLRRTLRIFPAFYAFLLITLLVNALGLAPVRVSGATAAFLYSGDYHRIGSSTFFHSWSLAVEEQFYLLWPAALLLVGLRRAMSLPIAVILACPLIRLAELVLEQRYGVTPFGLDYHYRFDTQADALATGCLLALLRPRLHETGWYRRLLASRWIAMAPILALAIGEVQPWEHPALLPFYAVPGFTLMNAAIALSLDRVMTYPAGSVTRMLNWRPVAYAGVLSYSIYIWQEVFLRPDREYWYTGLPLALVLLAIFVLASHYGVERPFLRLRRRLEMRRAHTAEQPASEPQLAIS